MLKDIKNDFEMNKITKKDYIDKMYEIHKNLFDYSEYLQETNISRIEVLDNKVIMTFRDSDIQFLCKPNDKRIVTFETINFGSYEQDELLMQRNLIGPNFNIFDIGANYGWYSINLAKRFPQAKVYAFEPIPSTYEYLLQNVRLNGLQNIDLLNFGFSDVKGSFQFFYDQSISGNASLKNVSGAEIIESINCRVDTLDQFVEAHQIAVDFIKCDVEGAELLVLRGGWKSITLQRPVIFLEMLRKWSSRFNYHPNDIIDLMSSAGYDCFTVSHDRLIRFQRVTDDTVETNYFFLHKEKHSTLIDRFSR